MKKGVKYSLIALFIISLLSFSPKTKMAARAFYFKKSPLACEFKGKNLYGKVQFVTSHPDIKIQYVDAYADINVQMVTSGATTCGKWQEVSSSPDLKIQIVNSFPDLKVKLVTSNPGMN